MGHQQHFACGEQAGSAQDVTETRGYLWGAGLVLRASAWREIEASGFRFFNGDRSGRALSSGGDTELCAALALAGWRLHYEPGLRLRHFMPEGRLNRAYHERLLQGFGEASIVLEVYLNALSGKPTLRRDQLVDTMRLLSSWMRARMWSEPQRAERRMKRSF